jgi:hypothetical protein
MSLGRGKPKLSSVAEGLRVRTRLELGFPDGALVVVTDHARPFWTHDGTPIEQVQPVCGTCGTQHFAKTYHIQLRAGAAIVSHGVWAGLQGLADNPFELVNTVAEPPAQGIVPYSNKPVELIEKFVMPILTK